MSDCPPTSSTNSINQNNNLSGSEQEIPPGIRRLFEAPPRTTPFEPVKYTRVVRVDLCGTNSPGFDLDVKKFDFEFAVFKEVANLTNEQICLIAYYTCEALKTMENGLCDNQFDFFSTLQTVNSKLNDPYKLTKKQECHIEEYINSRFKVILAKLGVSDNINLYASLRSFEIDPLVIAYIAAKLSDAKYELEYPKIVKDLLPIVSPIAAKTAKTKTVSKSKNQIATISTENKLALSSVFGVFYRPFPSSFDIRFNGPTAVIFKSNINNLRFMPEAFIFTNPRDMIYYRQQFVSQNLKWCSFVNAYDRGDAQDTLPSRTPYNQEHKIDLSMVLCVFDETFIHLETGDIDPKTGEVKIDTCDKGKWFFTPIKVDPPHPNGGKD